jgi:hypothetical protein
MAREKDSNLITTQKLSDPHLLYASVAYTLSSPINH